MKRQELAVLVCYVFLVYPMFVVAGSDRRTLLVFRKTGPTPAGFPRRPGLARKRPLA